MRIAVTADLHWGIHAAGDAATRLLVGELDANPPDVLILAGDVGAADEFDPALALFDGLDCRKALVPGNHDVWVADDDPRGDSLAVYQEYLPARSAAHGFHYLDHGPLIFDGIGLAVAGSMNWYDYTWADPAALAAAFPDWQDRLRTKQFTRGRHNDARFVHWPFDDRSFTADAVAVFDRHLRAAEAAANVIVVTHHPPFRALNFPRSGPPTPDSLLWDAFAGNQAMEDLLARHDGRVPFAFCGHTHRAREGTLAGIRGYNVGSDYPYKRLLLLNWPAGTVSEQTFDVR
ncbi:MAG TPA: metallophosphoesterase [Gemmataceae bacterium]